MRPDDARLVLDLVDEVKHGHYRDGEEDGEEGLDALQGGQGAVADRREACPELQRDDYGVEGQPDVRPVHARLGAEGELVEKVTLPGPCAAEADVRQADAAPGEDRGETGDGEHPVESLALLVRSREVTEEAKGRSHGDADHRTAFAVDIAEDAWCLAKVCQSG